MLCTKKSGFIIFLVLQLGLLVHSEPISPVHTISSFISSNSSESGCEPLTLVPQNEQCKFVHEYCGDEKIGYLNYLSMYYCGNRLLSVMTFAICLTVCFTTLGLTASDFLCPNLSTISNFLHMSDGLAGVTLLALGNAAPDIFSNYTAMGVGSGSLAIGELMGAALFITSVVVGSMSIVHPFKVAKKPFIRDILFFTVCVTLIVIFISDGYLSQLECMILLSWYISYVVFVVCWHWISSNKRLNQILHKRAREAYIDDTLEEFHLESDDEFTNDAIFNTLPSIDDLIQNTELTYGDGVVSSAPNIKSYNQLTNMVHSTGNFAGGLVRPSLLGALEFNSLLKKLQQEQSLPSFATQNDADYQPISLNIVRPPTNPTSASTPEPIRPYRDDPDENPESEDNYEARTVDASTVQTSTDAGSDTFNASAFSLNTNGIFEKLNQIIYQASQDQHNNELLAQYFPNLVGFRKKDVLSKIFTLMCTPLIFLLRVTIPVRENGSETSSSKSKRDHFLIKMQCFLSPLTITVFMISDSYFYIALMLTIILGGLLYSVVSVRFEKGEDNLDNAINLTLALLGFITSVSWISVIATEVVSILKAVSLIYDLSDAILGLTIFAIGNSLGDFIANFTIAKMGMPIMAFGACFGGPLLSLCSFGISGLIVIPNKSHLSVIDERGYRINVTTTLIVSSVALLMNAFFLLIAVPWNGWRMNKTVGYVLIGTWCVSTIIGVLVELVK